MKEKKNWITPTVELLSRGYVEGGNNPNVHEKTGHPSGNPQFNHSAGTPLSSFVNYAGTKKVQHFSNAAS